MIIDNYKSIVERAIEKDVFPLKGRFQKLAGIKPKSTYLIEITFEIDNQLLEYVNINQFKKTTNRYRKDSEQKNPPVKAHYHIFSKNGKKEIYAINLDGTAHHQKHKGYLIPNKEADELRRLGVKLNNNNIIEILYLNNKTESKLLLESIQKDCLSVFIEIDEESA